MATIVIAILGIILVQIANHLELKTYKLNVLRWLKVMRIIGIAMVIISIIIAVCNVEMGCIPEWLLIGGGILLAIFILGAILGIADALVELIKAIPSGIFMLILGTVLNWLVWEFLPGLFELTLIITIILIVISLFNKK